MITGYQTVDNSSLLCLPLCTAGEESRSCSCHSCTDCATHCQCVISGSCCGAMVLPTTSPVTSAALLLLLMLMIVLPWEVYTLTPAVNKCLGPAGLTADCSTTPNPATPNCLVTCKSATREAECTCCRAGYELLPSKQCSACPVGTFARTASNQCTPCRTGSTTFGPASNACGREYCREMACFSYAYMMHVSLYFP
jgi:hypothetical protein